MSSPQENTAMPREHSVGRRIIAIARMARSWVDVRLAPYGIGLSQAQILVVLYDGDGISQNEIGSQLHIDKSSMARTIRRLVDEGYVERQDDPADERAYRVVLTARAHGEREAIVSILREWTAAATEELTDREFGVLSDLLARVAHRAEQLAHDTRTHDAL